MLSDYLTYTYLYLCGRYNRRPFPLKKDEKIYNVQKRLQRRLKEQDVSYNPSHTYLMRDQLVVQKFVQLQQNVLEPLLQQEVAARFGQINYQPTWIIIQVPPDERALRALRHQPLVARRQSS